ncbi:pirin family protein [Actinacidiphila glaucinigra]|uniref:pirin family protein n=1 Tax=Actinacidiphila glaucinigra TaxID=235986 RepID=UPI002E371341|nr:pirin family protein [Actinacidiphila glaucinigra]
MATQLDVRRAGQRFHTRAGWLDSHHCFSFSHHYDPKNTHFGLLLVSNDDVVAPGTGFDTHPHRDMEIVTWVLDGGLVHQDSEGHNGVIYPGLAQRMSAGTGILHSEKNDSWKLTGAPEHKDPVHFVQMWVFPDEQGIKPGYEQLDINGELARGGWVTVASGMDRDRDERAISIAQKHAALQAARMSPQQTLALPTAPFAHLYVAKGEVALEGAGLLAKGDAVRVTGAEGQRVTAGAEGAEVLVWEMDAAVTFG